MAQSKASGTRKTPSSSRRKKSAAKPIRRELWGVVCLMLSLFTALGIFIEGFWLIDALCLYVFKGLFGWGYFIVPPMFLSASIVLFRHHGKPVTARLICLFLLPMLFGATVHMIRCGAEYSMQMTTPTQYYFTGIALESGGLISSYLSELLRQAVSAYGALPILILGMMICILVAGAVDFRKLTAVRETRPMYVPEPEPQRARAAADDLPQVFEGAKRRRAPKESIDIPLDDEKTGRSRKKDAPGAEEDTQSGIKGKVNSLLHPEKAPDREPEIPTETFNPDDDIPPMPRGKTALNKLSAGMSADMLLAEMTGVSSDGEEEPQVESASVHIPEPDDDSLDEQLIDEIHEKVHHDEVRRAAAEVSREIREAEPPREYCYPPLALLNPGDGRSKIDGREEINLNRERLEATLKSFGIGARITGVIHGPTVTRYDLELEAGLRLTKLTNLAGDLALSLGVASVRIAPIPDRIATVGVEVPNKLTSTVYLREVIASPAFQKAQSRLSFAIGMDISGNCIVGNISKLPHMLIAGTTGSGKSVCMNCLILSLLYKASPDEVRLIMIDPKMVELGIYNGIPHLYIPVVTDPKKAAGSLQWSVVEMMKRYRLFSEVGVRDLSGYNKYQRENGGETLPSLVIVIDELADLMMTAAKEVEESICRVAQMGRAAGVHLIIATQRPSADVITGLMKANIPSRIAFAVSSAMESRIIMDQQGAEKLIGMGDMLYSPIGCGKPLRIQGAFVSDEEREEVISFIKRDSEPNYDENAMKDIERAAAEKEAGRERGGHTPNVEAAAEGDTLFSEYDELLPDAVDVIFECKQASTSMLQRRMKLGYARAGRIMDQMEELGIVGPPEGSKPRQILMDQARWEELRMNGKTPLQRLMDEQKDDFSQERNE